MSVGESCRPSGYQWLNGVLVVLLLQGLGCGGTTSGQDVHGVDLVHDHGGGDVVQHDAPGTETDSSSDLVAPPDGHDPVDLIEVDLETMDLTQPPEECTGAFSVEDLDGNPVEIPAGADDGLNWVFDPTVVRDYTIEIEPEDLLWLKDHILDEEYVPASLVADGLRFRGVAARYKGDWTSLYSCVDAVTGFPTCPKLSMKLRFNKYDPCGRFHGLRRLVFNANINDYSLLRERLAYTLMTRLGMPASRVTHSKVRVNDEAYSVFTQVEAVDHEFLERRYANATGNLYKGIWPKSTVPDDYFWTLETNEEEMNVTHMVEFAEAVEAAKSVGFTADMAKFANTEEIARHMAFFVGTGEMDGILWFWCHDGDCTSGNYYWYDDPDTTFHLIPWDREAAFFSVWEPGWLTPEWWKKPDVCEPISYYLFTEGAAQGADDPLIMPPQCDKLLSESILANPEAYLDTMQRLAVELGLALEELDSLKALLQQPVEEDPNLPMSLETWDDAIGWLADNLTGQKAAIEAMLQSR